MFKQWRHWNVVTFGLVLIFVVCLTCFGLDQQGSNRRADRKTSTALTINVTASHYSIKLPPKSADLLPLNCEPTESKVRLYASSTTPHGGKLNFSWKVPVGRLIEKNREVTWDLSRVEAGTYTATVDARDSHKHTATGSIMVTVVICPGWRPDPPPCPVVSVSCPSSVDSKNSLTFEATVAGGDPSLTLTYKWSLSAGKIISGEGTSKITVDVSGVSPEPVTATVSVGSEMPSCARVASCTTAVAESVLPGAR